MMWTPEIGLALLLILPALSLLGIVVAGRWPNVRDGWNLITSALLLADVAALIGAVHAGARPGLTLVDLGHGLALQFSLEPLGAVFAGVAACLFLINTFFGIGYMRGNKAKDQTRFFAAFAVAIASALGVAAAGNMLTLFVFYEALSLSTFPLVTHNGDAKARRGGRIYLTTLMGTSIGLFLPALIIVQVIAGSTDFVPGGLLTGQVSPVMASVLLFLFAFGIAKAALMPVHNWLPNAMVAPTPVSAFLHAVAVVKAGVFTMLKMVVYLMGAQTVQHAPISPWLAGVAAISIVAGSLVALSQDNLKARLAWSTVSQLSYITIGAMVATPLALMGALLQIVMHAFGKITLFMSAGAIYTANHATRVSQMWGMARKLPVIFIAFFVGSLSIIGLPPFAGVWPKLFLIMGFTGEGHRWLIIALVVSSLLNVLYLLPVSLNAFMKPVPVKEDGSPVIEAGKMPILTWLPPVFTAAMTLVLFFFAGQIMDFVRPVFEVGG